MTKPDNDQQDWPRRLSQESHGLGSLMRSYIRRLEGSEDEGAAFVRAREIVQRRGRQRQVIATGLLAAAAVSALWLLVGRLSLTTLATNDSKITAASGPPAAKVAIPAPPAAPGINPIPRTPTTGRAGLASAAPVAETPTGSSARRSLPFPVGLRAHTLPLRHAPAALSAGGTVIRQHSATQAFAVLNESGQAVAWSHGKETGITLASGRIELRVRPRAPGHTFVVHAAPFDFVVVGTVFRVDRGSQKVALIVSEGRVSVRRRERVLASIGHGESWGGAIDSKDDDKDEGKGGGRAQPTSAPVAAAAAEVTDPVPAPANRASRAHESQPSSPPALSSEPLRATKAPDALMEKPAAPAPVPPASPAWSRCATLADGASADGRAQARAAIDCYEGVAAQGAAADNEVAAYEAARLWKDIGSDLERARKGFVAYRDRFPGGSLRVEASLSLLEILPRLGRLDEALDESDRLLTDAEAAPRRAEVHVIRGNIFRLGRRDLRPALSEYRAAAQGQGQGADDGAYFLAVCLAEMGQAQQARQAFDDYLDRKTPRHQAEARRLRDALRLHLQEPRVR